MPNWISDPDTSTYLLLFILVLAGVGLWARTRKRWAAIVSIVLGLLLLGLFLADYFIESPREEAVRKVNLMVAAFNKNDWPQLSENLAESFQVNGVKKTELKTKFDFAQQLQVKVKAWNFDKQEVKILNDNTVEICFDASGDAQGRSLPVFIRATFVKEADGKYRMQTMKIFNFVNRRDEQAIPGLP